MAMIGDRKTNIFGKLVRQKVVFFEEVGPALRRGNSCRDGRVNDVAFPISLVYLLCVCVCIRTQSVPVPVGR